MFPASCYPLIVSRHSMVSYVANLPTFLQCEPASYACLAIIMAFSRITACIFALENCEYERWRVPGPRVTAIPFANMSGAIVPLVESAPRDLRPCMMTVS
jgi:hypothetical protein